MLSLGSNIFPVNALSKQKRAMFHKMRKMRGSKLIRYAVGLVDLNKYLDVLHGSKISGFIL